MEARSLSTSGSDGDQAVDARAAITTLFEAEYPRLCRLAYLLVGDRGRAEEIVMEAFVRSLAGWRRVREPDKAGAYVRRAVVNLASNRRRRAWLEVRHLAVTRSAEATSPAADEDNAGAVWQAVRALPPRQRATITLRYWDDLSEADIAAALGCSVGTVKSQLAKARASLARALQLDEREQR